MTDTFEIHTLLFLQKPEILEQQRQQVSDRLAAALPGLQIMFASSPDDIPPGTYFDVVITPTLPWLPQLLNQLAGYRWIHFLSAGVEKIWDMGLDKPGLLLSKSSGVNSVPMSEYAIGAMLHFAKQFGRFQEQGREARWERVWLDELTGRRVAVLGLGHVGQAVAARARAFDMSVVGTLRHPRPMQGITRVVAPERTRELLADADYLVVCLPLTANTRGFVDDELLTALKPGAVLIDMSRGGVVSADAVLRALDGGLLRGAALDVFEMQPLPAESPLWRRSDVLVTPHVSGTTPYYLDRALDIFLKNADSLRKKRCLTTSVDSVSGY
ncbi:D-2-hydroxyacid dehydrogenase [Halomonas sp. IOP_31]|uniref:D-2-hydroxyacid dehydrogenase n=1 Tax=Halomonas sp. IOP_31 TaxID=2876584 RepID=UPI001E2C78B7|nr:D-2-hydroxyacid dehydrogenase [Halomonas sp. IOP_31]MCD6007024.1 D-2-hydroxyacid dehydrogenase [Halomonas sp. IOP_31]